MNYNEEALKMHESVNAAKLVGKKLEDLKVVLNGPGAAGTAIIKMIMFAGVKNVIACDRSGILCKSRPGGVSGHKLDLCQITNLEERTGTLADAVVGARNINYDMKMAAAQAIAGIVSEDELLMYPQGTFCVTSKDSQEHSWLFLKERNRIHLKQGFCVVRQFRYR